MILHDSTAPPEDIINAIFSLRLTITLFNGDEFPTTIELL